MCEDSAEKKPRTRIDIFLNGESVRSASVYPANVEPILSVIDETFGDGGCSWDEIAEHLAEEIVEIAAGRPSSASSMTINGLALWLACRGANGQPSKGEGLAKEGNHNFEIRVTGGPYHVKVGVGPLETHHELHDLLQVLDKRLRADGAPTAPPEASRAPAESGEHETISEDNAETC
jgi:hypothetical protein